MDVFQELISRYDLMAEDGVIALSQLGLYWYATDFVKVVRIDDPELDKKLTERFIGSSAVLYEDGQAVAVDIPGKGVRFIEKGAGHVL